MSVPTKCNQKGCDGMAMFRFTWPGKDEAGVCIVHAPQLAGLARHMSFHLQLIPITNAESIAALTEEARDEH